MFKQVFDAAELVKLIKKLVSIDADWVPVASKDAPSALYIRPTSIGTEVMHLYLKLIRPLFFYFLFLRFFPQKVRVGGGNKIKNKITIHNLS